MHRTFTALAGATVLGLALAASCGSASSGSGSQTVAYTAPLTAHHKTSCTSGGDVDWGTHQSTSTTNAWAQADWEILPQPQPACSTQIRVRVLTAAGFNYRSGWVKALELPTRATGTDGSQMTHAWLEAQYTGFPSTRSCEQIYPVQGSWAGCPNGGAKTSPAGLLPAPRTQAELPPECNTIRLVTPSGQSIWLTACGSGPGNESAFQDWTGASPARQTEIMDGITTIDPATCTKASPCVLIGQSTPAS